MQLFFILGSHLSKRKLTVMLLKSIAIFIFCFVCMFENISAQWMPATRTISTPRGDVKIRDAVWMPRYRNYYSQKSNGKYNYANRKHDYTIVYLNDSVLTVKAKINIDDSVHCLEWGKKAELNSVRPNETKEIYRLDEVGDKLTGKPLDSCWIFLTDRGKINTYSVTSEMDDPLIAYIQKGDSGEILSLTEENVKAMINDNDEALKLLEQKGLLKAIEKYNEE